MIKKAKSFVTLSLGVAITSQNMIISSADEVAILSDDEFKVKINTNDNNSNSTEINKFDEYQVDPEEEITYSMGGSLGRSLPSVANLETTTLSNPKSIGSGNVTTDNLNVRSGPSSNYSKLGILTKGTKVEVVERYSNGWYKIKYKGSYGYVSGAYVSLDGSKGEVIATGKTTAGLNVRSGAGTGYKKIGHLNKNLYIYRKHENSLTGTRKKDINRQLYRLRIKHIDYLVSNVNREYKEKLFLEMLSQNIDDYENLLNKFWQKAEDMKKYLWIKMSNKIENNKKIVLFGAGIIANRAIDYFRRERIECIIDNSKDRIGMKLQGIDIVSLDGYINDVRRDRDSQVVIAVGNNYVLAIAEQLKNNGISEFCWFKAIENCVKETI